jgi:carboxy-cis,cis-muconate cyclase
VKQLFITPTTAGGGSSNAITPAFFSDEWMAIADTSNGFVEIWQFSNDTETARPVARADINDGGCCANAIWYD